MDGEESLCGGRALPFQVHIVLHYAVLNDLIVSQSVVQVSGCVR